MGDRIERIFNDPKVLIRSLERFEAHQAESVGEVIGFKISVVKYGPDSIKWAGPTE